MKSTKIDNDENHSNQRMIYCPVCKKKGISFNVQRLFSGYCHICGSESLVLQNYGLQVYFPPSLSRDSVYWDTIELASNGDSLAFLEITVSPALFGAYEVMDDAL